MSAIAVIPARGGSKGIPGKNLVKLGGKPLIEWTISAAADSGIFDHIVVSTDSQEIAESSRRMGAEVPFLRPQYLASDDSPTLPVILHVLSFYSSDITVLLQPTSPLRTGGDICAAYNRHLATGRPVVSVTPAKPWLFTVSEDGRLSQFTTSLEQRQATSVFAPNGAIYVTSSEALKSGGTWWDDPVAYEMPFSRSIDIDTPDDLRVAEIFALSASDMGSSNAP